MAVAVAVRQAVAARMHAAFLAASVGETLPVLFETAEEGSVGHSDTYLPVTVPIPGLRGQLREVRILSAGPDGLSGELSD